jgi:hypothetical protein
MTYLQSVRFAGFVVLAVFASAIVVTPAQAQNDTFTQVGTWHCDPTTAPACAQVNFAKQFGSAPDMIIGFDSMSPSAYDCENGTPKVVSTNVTPSGFRPEAYIDCSGYPHAPFNTSTSGWWVAVGNFLNRGTVMPNYLVLSVIYAPPGTNGGHARVQFHIKRAVRLVRR